MKFKIFVHGQDGKMGKEIKKLVKKNKNILIVESLKNSFDVIIDFTRPTGTLNILKWAVINKKPIVIGTTGFSNKELKLIKTSSKKIPILFSPNMSLGINALLPVLVAFAKNFESKIEISEIHHKQKKDNPSGTALLIQKTIQDHFKNTDIKKPKGLRKGSVVGVHNVLFSTTEESVLFCHVAHKRAVFAKGAIKAAEWLSKQKNGFYNFKDMLGE